MKKQARRHRQSTARLNPYASTPAALAIFTAIRRRLVQFDPNQGSDLPTVFQMAPQ
jgi:hypothetical protein